MPKITQYNAPNPSPQAVGTPGTSKVGEIIGSTISSLGEMIAKLEDGKAANQATIKLGDFDREYTEIKGRLQQFYFDDPIAFPRALKEAALSLRDGYSKDLPSAVYAKFKLATDNMIAQNESANMGWALSREKDQIVGDIKEGYAELAVKAEGELTVPGVQKIIHGDGSGVDLSLSAQNMRASGFFNPHEIGQINRETEKAILDSHLWARVAVEPGRVLADITSGKYDQAGLKVSLSEWGPRAQKALATQKLAEDYHALAASTVEMSEAIDAAMGGKMTVADANRNVEWSRINLGTPGATDNRLRLWENIRNVLAGQDFRSTEMKAQDQTNFIDKFNTNYNKFMLQRPGKGKPSPKDWDDVIGLYGDLLEAYQGGVINEETFLTKKSIIDPVLKERLGNKKRPATLTEALRGAGKYSFFDNPRDIYSVGYSIIRKYVERERPDLSDASRSDLRDALMVAFTKRVEGLTPEQMVSKEQAALSILRGSGSVAGIIAQLGVFELKDGQKVMPGQIVTYQNQRVLFIGVDPATGKLKFLQQKGFTDEVGK